MQHSFDIDIAKEYGILEAVLINNLDFWISKNEANESNYHDGYYWTYNSTRAFAELFPYVSERQIKAALKSLRDRGIIQTGNYNSQPYDRTLWYAFTDLGLSIVRNGTMDGTKTDNGKAENVRPIPDIKPDITPNRKPDIDVRRRFTPPTVEEVREYCQERNNGIDPENFVDFYASKGWKVGKEPMKDWRASVRTWERRNGRASKPKVYTSNDDEQWPEF